MAKFNPDQFEFPFNKKPRPQGYGPKSVSEGFKGAAKPRLAVPTNAELKDGLRRLIKKHKGLANIPDAEVKKFLNRFRNHPIKKGLSASNPTQAKQALKTISDKFFKVKKASKTPAAAKGQAKGQLKLRQEYEANKGKAPAKFSKWDSGKQGSPKPPKVGAQILGKFAKESKPSFPRGVNPKARAGSKGINPKGLGQRGMAPLTAGQPTADRIAAYAARAGAAGAGGAGAGGAGAAAAASTAAPPMAGGVAAGKAVAGSAAKRGIAGGLMRGLGAMTGGGVGLGLLALSMLPVILATKKMSKSEQQKKLNEAIQAQQQQGLMAGADAPGAFENLQRGTYKSQLGNAQRFARANEPKRMSPELEALLAGSREELMAAMKQRQNSGGGLQLSEIMSANFGRGM